ncbi:MAG: M20 family metallopeptidase [Archaeoglobaceae archaeon]|nr:M20 family metallopeptidase [Archaeoglobaceae archaeon]MDW8128724.1 M20 family metallopeptidase [Archaeoglobaceae archaeon]
MSKLEVDEVELTKKLIKIDTRNPPGDTSQAVEFLETLFSSFKTKKYVNEGKESLLVEISKGEKTLMLSSHLDTVPSAEELLNPVVVNGKLYGRGSCDAKGCIASICSAVLKLEDIEIGLKLAFTADEEVGGKNGLKKVFEAEKCDAVVIGEPTGCNSINVLQACVLALDFEFEGKDGHTATRDAKEGAIFKASQFISEALDFFKNIKGNYEPYKTLFETLEIPFVIKTWEAVFNPSMINGGIKRNVVAPKCFLSADIRFAPWISVEEILKIFEKKSLKFKVSGFLPSYGILVDSVPLEKDLRLLRIILDAIRAEKLEPRAIFSLGVGDTRHVRKFGIPAFYFGPGGENMHSEDEFVYISELKLATKIYQRILENFKKF